MSKKEIQGTGTLIGTGTDDPLNRECVGCMCNPSGEHRPSLIPGSLHWWFVVMRTANPLRKIN